MPGFQSTRLATEGALEPFFFLYTDDSIQGNPETCKQSSIMLNYEVKNNIPGSYAQERIKTVKSIISKNSNSYWPNQYDSLVICEAYKNTIGKEIANLYDIDYVFVAISTCGTIAGISQAIKEHSPDTKIIAVDIEGSKIFRNDSTVKKINGMGASFRPANLGRAYIDDVMIITTEE